MIVAFLLSFYSMKAQGFMQYDFHTSDQPIAVPGKFADEDAVITYKEVEILHKQFEDSLKYLDSYRPQKAEYYKKTKHYRIKVQTMKGLEDKSKVTLYHNPDQNFKVLGVRCIKSNGKVIDIGPEDISTQEHLLEKDEPYISIEISFPNLDIGDEIEYVYAWEYDENVRWGDIYFHDDLPVVWSKVFFCFDKDLHPWVKSYNNVPEKIYHEDSLSVVHEYTLRSLPGIQDQEKSIEEIELPFLRFISVSRTVSPFNVYKPDARIRGNYSINIKLGYKKSKKTILSNPCINKDMNKYEKLYALHDYINKNIELAELSGKESDKPVSYFFETKKMNSLNRTHIYVTIFNILEIPYEFVLARNRYRGPLDRNYLYRDQFNMVLFRFVDHNGMSSFLFPKTENNYYEINELPLQYYGASGYPISLDREKEATFLKFNTPENLTHFENRQLKVRIDFNENQTFCEIDHSFGGGEYTRYKMDFFDAVKSFNKNEFKSVEHITWIEDHDQCELKSIQIDSVSGTYLKLHYELESSVNLVAFDSAIFAFPVKNLLSHYSDINKNEKRVLTYYPPNDFVHKINAFILFDSPVELLNATDFNTNYNSKVCGFNVKAAQINDTTIYLHSEYKLKTNVIRAYEYVQLNEMNNIWEEAKQLNMILRTK